MIKLKSAKAAYVPYVNLGHIVKNYVSTVDVTIAVKGNLMYTIVAVIYKRYRWRR